MELRRISRRESIKWVVAASATVSLLSTKGLGVGSIAHGYGQDPKLLEPYKPGDLWPLTFSKEQRRTAIALCDAIIPTDERSPSASQLNVHDFIDEWIKIVTRARSQAGNCLRPGVTVDAQGAVSAAGGNVPVPSDRAGIAGISQAAGVGI